MSKIGNIIIGLTFGSIAIGLNSCKKEYVPRYPKVENLLTNYGTDTQKLSSSWRNGAIGYADAQSSLDSAAFRNIFNSTEAVKDSAKVTEFNNLAKTNRIPEYINTSRAANVYFSRKLREKIHTYKEYESLHNYIVSTQNQADEEINLVKKQFVTDSIGYTKFFFKHNLFNDSTFRKNYTKTIQKIRP